MTNFAKNIKYLRNKQGMNQAQFAKSINVTKPRLSGWEIAHSYPQIDVLLRMGELFDINLYDLLVLELKDGYKPNTFDPQSKKDTNTKGELSFNQVETISGVIDTLHGFLASDGVGNSM